MRLRGRFPLKLITVPTDPISGDGAVGAAMMKGVRPSRRDGADPVAELRQCRGVGRDAGLVAELCLAARSSRLLAPAGSGAAGRTADPAVACRTWRGRSRWLGAGRDRLATLVLGDLGAICLVAL